MPSIGYINNNKLNNQILQNKKEKLFQNKINTIKTLSFQAREALKQYIVTTNPSDLDIYYSKIQSLENSINQIDFQKEQNVYELFQIWSEYVNKKIMGINKLSRSQYTINDIIKEINTQKGKNYFDIFRIKIDTFIKTEEYLLKGRKEIFSESIDTSKNISSKDVIQNVHWVDHTHIVIVKAKELLVYALNIETGARGYLITGNKTFLEPYEHSVKIFFTKLRELKQTVSDNPEQVSALKVMNIHMKEWLDNVIKPLINIRAKISDLAAEQNVLDNLMDEKEKNLFNNLNKELDKTINNKKGTNI